jgi:hypothetical protein
MIPARSRAPRDQRGVATVEAALVICMFLLPLLLGMINYGNYFWQAQKAAPLSSRLPLDKVVGTFTCPQLVGALKSTVLTSLPAVSGGHDDDLDVNDVRVEVVRVLPAVGAEVSVTVLLPAVDLLNGLIPLPDGGVLASEASYLLKNVVVTTGVCRG